MLQSRNNTGVAQPTISLYNSAIVHFEFRIESLCVDILSDATVVECGFQFYASVILYAAGYIG